MGAEFLATIFIGCLNACLVQPVAYVERTVFYRERAAGTPPVEPSLVTCDWAVLV